MTDREICENEWKPLEVDNLPSDIFKQNKEGQPIYEYEVFILDVWKRIDYIHHRIYDLVGGYDEHKYRYRKRQPEEKSVEEMAEEYCNDKYGEMPEYPITIKDIHKLLKVEKWTASKDAYIAGYKAAKC